MKVRLFDASEAPLRLKSLILVCYACLISVCSAVHTPFNDETDIWVFARDTNVHDSLHFFAYTGHPPLWHGVLFPFARSGLPVETMAAINVFFAIAVAWLVLFRSPFSFRIQLLFLFSTPIFYQYAVFQRGYMLMILLLCLIGTNYAGRLEKPFRYGALLALLFNSETFAIIPAAILSAWFALECLQRPQRFRRNGTAMAIVAIGAAVALLSLLPPDDIRDQFKGLHYNPESFLNAIDFGFIPIDGGWITNVLGPLTIVSGAIYLLNTRWLILLLGWLAWVGFIFIGKYPPQPWHCELIPVLMMWTLWLSRTGTPAPEDNNNLACRFLATALACTFVVSDCMALGHHFQEYANPYSGGTDMASFIRQNGYDHDLIISVACHQTTAVSAYLPGTKFWIGGQNRLSAFALWNRSLDTCLSMPADDKIREGLNQHKTSDQVILSTSELSASQEGKLHLLHFSPGTRRSYYLYELRENN